MVRPGSVARVMLVTLAVLRRRHWISGIGVLLTVAAVISGISGCGPGIPEESTQPVVFAAGESVTVVSGVMGSLGGRIEAGHSGTPIDGITVEFPEGAFTGDTDVSLGYDTGTLSPNEGVYAGFALVMDTGDTTQFVEPIAITVPFDDTDTTPVPYYIDSEGRLHPTQLTAIDRTEETFTFQTYHASLFTWIKNWLVQPVYAPSEDDIVETDYRPGNDGFQIRNRGGDYTDGGECFGMTSFSLWYYLNHKSTKGDFYPKYMNVVGTDSDGKPLHVQDIIASRAHISIAQQWHASYSGLVGQELTLSDEDRWASITNAILNTGRPVLLYVRATFPKSAHSVLAYRCNLLGHISVYDPSFPNQSRSITYDKASKSFANYMAIYDEIVLCGDGALYWTEPYQSILDDADANFQYSEGATINIASHTDGQEVNEHDITVTGSIQSGEVLVSRFSVFVGSTMFSVEVEHDGAFSVPLNLESGINHLQFVTEGYDKSGKLVTVGNNMITRDFTIIAKSEEEPVHFPDPNLEAAIREAIEKPTGDIYPSDLEGLTRLDARERGIADLTGLEYCTDLTHLYLLHNEISELSPLSNLISLRVLWLDENQISDVYALANLTGLTDLQIGLNEIIDISPLANLINLAGLGLCCNQISDISALSNLTSLTSLSLWINKVSDISALAGLTKLSYLSLGDNQISNISLLEGLTNLSELWLHDNSISDIKPLLDNTGLGEGDEVYLYNNPLSEDSVNVYIPALEARGVTVEYWGS